MFDINKLGFASPAKTQVLEPDFESVVLPNTREEMSMAAAISGRAMLDPAIARFFVLEERPVRYLQLRQPGGKPYMDVSVDGKVKRFYVFALPKAQGSAEYHDDPASMFAVQCAVSQVGPGAVSILPEKLMRGPDCYFVMSVSFACCSTGAARGRAMLYADNSESGGPFLNMGFSGDGMRPEIRTMWKNLDAVVLDGMGLQALAHLARDVTGTCTHHGRMVSLGKASSWKGGRLTLG